MWLELEFCLLAPTWGTYAPHSNGAEMQMSINRISILLFRDRAGLSSISHFAW